MTNCCEFRFLVGADLLPATGFRMNFLLKCSAGGISKFIMQSLLLVTRIFSQFVNSCLFDVFFNRLYLGFIVVEESAVAAHVRKEKHAMGCK